MIRVTAGPGWRRLENRHRKDLVVSVDHLLPFTPVVLGQLHDMVPSPQHLYISQSIAKPSEDAVTYLRTEVDLTGQTLIEGTMVQHDGECYTVLAPVMRLLLVVSQMDPVEFKLLEMSQVAVVVPMVVGTRVMSPPTASRKRKVADDPDFLPDIPRRSVKARVIDGEHDKLFAASVTESNVVKPFGRNLRFVSPQELYQMFQLLVERFPPPVEDEPAPCGLMELMGEFEVLPLYVTGHSIQGELKQIMTYDDSFLALSYLPSHTIMYLPFLMKSLGAQDALHAPRSGVQSITSCPQRHKRTWAFWLCSTTNSDPQDHHLQRAAEALGNQLSGVAKAVVDKPTIAHFRITSPQLRVNLTPRIGEIQGLVMARAIYKMVEYMSPAQRGALLERIRRHALKVQICLPEPGALEAYTSSPPSTEIPWDAAPSLLDHEVRVEVNWQHMYQVSLAAKDLR